MAGSQGGGPASCVELLVWLNQLCETIPEACVPQCSGWLKGAKEQMCQLLSRSGRLERSSNGGCFGEQPHGSPVHISTQGGEMLFLLLEESY